MTVGLVCFSIGFVVSLMNFYLLKSSSTHVIKFPSKVSVLVAVFYRDIDLVAKKAGRTQYFIVTRFGATLKLG